MLRTSRLTGFWTKTIEERVRELVERGFLPAGAAGTLVGGGLTPAEADKLSENVVGVTALPFSVATNFAVNGVDRLVAMSVEEPSVVAAASNAARMVRESGAGFEAAIESHLMIAQVEVRGTGDARAAAAAVEARKEEVLGECRRNSCEIERFGGSVHDLEARVVPLEGGGERLVVHVLVDCADAMGANTLNTIAERTAPLIAGIAGGRPGLRILSNLADRRIVRAGCRVTLPVLARYKGAKGGEEAEGLTGEDVRDLFLDAALLAASDPWRAATHNKGIMNGVDAVAVATGNDWRAIEAGAHAYAAMGGRYRSLTTWRKDEADGALAGTLRMPIQAGLVGGMTKYHRCAALALAMMDVTSARELEMVMACAGLATNLAALLALSTEGIQRGHMRLHSRHTGD